MYVYCTYMYTHTHIHIACKRTSWTVSVAIIHMYTVHKPKCVNEYVMCVHVVLGLVPELKGGEGSDATVHVLLLVVQEELLHRE